MKMKNWFTQNAENLLRFLTQKMEICTYWVVQNAKNLLGGLGMG
jgi:hypothetical protein